jgi:hypothetical protein
MRILFHQACAFLPRGGGANLPENGNKAGRRVTFGRRNPKVLPGRRSIRQFPFTQHQPIDQTITMNRILSILLPTLVLLAGTTSQAAVIVTLPTPTTAGSFVITHDVTFTVSAPSGSSLAGFVFDEWVTSDGSLNGFTGGAFSPNSGVYSHNGGSAAGSINGFMDNIASAAGDLTANDGYILTTQTLVNLGDTITLKAASYTLAAGSLPAGFNAGVAQTFTGDIWPFSTAAGRLSPSVPAVPEPSAALLGGLAGIAGLRRRRRA